MINSIRFWVSLFMLAGLSSLALLNCNLSDQGERYVLDVKLNDSLSADKGVFKTVDISVYDTNGTLLQAGVFHGAYNLKDSLGFHALPLNAKPPNTFDIRITASKDSGESWVFTTRVANGVPGTPVPSHYGGQGGQKSVPKRIIITNPVLRSLTVGDPDITLTATVDPSDAPQDIVWAVSPPTFAEIQSGNKLRGLKPGSVVLTAAAKNSATIFDTLMLTVKPAPTSLPNSIHIQTPSPLILTVGGAALALSANVLPGDAAQDIIWSLPLTDLAVLEGGDKVRGLKAGSIKITATSAVAGSVSSTLDVTVQDPPADLPIAITPTQTALALLVGGPPGTLGASVAPPKASQDVIWTMEATGIAEIVGSNQIRGLKAGVAKAIATSVVKSTVTASVAITVTAPVADPESISLRMPVPMTLPSNGALGDLLWAVLPAGSDQEVEWTSSNLNVAQITTANKVKSFAPGKATITGKSKSKASVAVVFDVVVITPVKMDSIFIKPSKFTLYTGGADTVVTVRMVGTDTGAKYSLGSSDPLIASVTSGGVVKGLKAGAAVITAEVVGYSSVASACSVLVVTDPPIVTATPDQAIAYGGEAVFNVSVTQAYGAVTEIKADMDGDNVFEQAAAPGATQATFKQKYSTVKTYAVSFKAKDTEGNETTITRKVTVGAPGAPTVQIVSPSKDTAISSRSVKIRFTVKDTAAKIDTTIDSTVTALANGDNIIKVSRSNLGGVGTYQITVTVDVTPPATPVFAAQAQNPTGNNRPTWKWGAVADAAKYQVKFDSDTSKGMINVLAGTQYQPPAALADGVQTLYLRAVDAVGNVSAVISQAVTIKTTLPATPVLVSAPAAVSSVRTPVWKWKTGDATKGNGKYKVWLNDVEQTQLATPTYTAASLLDGSYILKVRELDDLGSESLDLAFASIKVDGTKPVITVTGRTAGDLVSLTTTRAATVAGSIVDQGGSAIATATWELSGGTTKAPVAIATPGTFSINTGNMTNGSSTTLTIKTTDGANNAASFTLVFNVNVPAPTLAFVSPTPADGYVSNGPVTAYYTVDNGPTQDTVLNLAAPSSGETSTTMPLTITVTNAGGSATITRTFYRTNAAVRFYTAAGTAGGDCNSWAKACKFEGNISGTGKYFWLQSGQYDMSGKAQPFSISGVQVYGGIKANGKNTLDRSGETVIFSNVASTGKSYAYNGAVFTKVTFTGDYSYQVFMFDPGATIKLVECKFAAITADGPSAYYGTLMGGSEVQLRFERCTFDNSAGNGAFMVSGKSDPYYNQFQDCTFIPRGTGPDAPNDFEGASGSSWYSYRFYNPTGAPKMYLDGGGVCGLPSSPSCP